MHKSHRLMEMYALHRENGNNVIVGEARCAELTKCKKLFVNVKITTWQNKTIFHELYHLRHDLNRESILN